MNQYLLTTKIQIPPLPVDTVRRERLFVALDRGLLPNSRVTLISAPAGYGKTTLLSAWLQSRDLAAAWLSISKSDNDAARFMSYLLAALSAAGENLDIPSLEDGQISPEKFKEHFLNPLINQLGRRPGQIAFVFDDYHLIKNQIVHDLLGYLLENQPAQAHIYLATRADPPLPIARLRGRGQVNELRLDDLRFRIEETTSFLNTLSDLQLAPDDVGTLQRRTEGWICGLQMTAVYLRGQEDVQGFIHSFSGSHHYIMDYLLDEVLRRESAELQTFLLETSILERLSAPLCDALRAEPGKISAPSRTLLRKLEQTNLFIVPLDEQREWYRYHRLFSDLLFARLQDEYPRHIPTLHRRASEWFAEQGYIEEAVDHAFSAADEDFAADVLERCAQEILLRSETATFLHWVQRLPGEQIQKRPKLGIYRAWALLLQGAPLTVVEAQIKESRAGQGPPGSSRSLEAIILLSQGQLEQGLTYAEEAMALLPPEELFLRDFAAICAASCRISLGEDEAAMQMMEQVTRSTQRSGNRLATVTILCELAELRLKQFQLDSAVTLYERSLAIGTDAQGVRRPMAGRALMGLGGIALERYDLEPARQLLLDGIRLAESWSLINTLDGYVSLGMLYDALGEETLLAETLATLDDLTQRFDASEFDDILVDMLKMRINLHRGDLIPVRKWVGDRGLAGVPGQKPAYVGDGAIASRIYKYELPLVARLHIAEARYHEALSVLQELEAQAGETRRPYLGIEGQILQARTYQCMGEPTSARAVLKKALDTAAPQKSRRVFLTEGEEIVQLLGAGDKFGDDPQTAAFVAGLLEKLGLLQTVSLSEIGGAGEQSRAGPALPSVLADPLSPRELEVLRLLPGSLNAPEMAAELVISVNTLRSHMKNIYAKLGVHSRHEAIIKAVELGLL